MECIIDTILYQLYYQDEFLENENYQILGFLLQNSSEICMTSESSKSCFSHIELEEEPQQAVKGCLEGLWECPTSDTSFP